MTARLRSESKYTVSLSFRFTFPDIVISGLIYRRGGFVVHQYRLIGPEWAWKQYISKDFWMRSGTCDQEFDRDDLFYCFEMTLWQKVSLNNRFCFREWSLHGKIVLIDCREIQALMGWQKLSSTDELPLLTWHGKLRPLCRNIYVQKACFLYSR